MNIPSWLLYLLITLIVSLPFYPGIFKATKKDDTNIEILYRRMLWIPGIVAFGLLVASGMGFEDIDFGIGEFLWLLPLAWLVPLIMEILLINLVARFGLARLDSTLIQFREGIVHISNTVQLLMGTAKQSYFKFALNLLITVTVGSLIMLLYAIPEELGWRGFLQMPLIQSFGLGSGLMFGGLLWGVWHAPIILAGYKFSEYPKLGAFVFWPIFTICLSIILGWLYWQTGSLLLPAVFSASTKISGRLSSIALGEAGDSRRVRVVWLWLWATLAVFILALWQVGGIANL
jgi:uncharacterized protein